MRNIIFFNKIGECDMKFSLASNNILPKWQASVAVASCRNFINYLIVKPLLEDSAL